MENFVWKICLILAVTIIGVLSRDSCVLIYEKDVPDKPDIILLTEGNKELKPAICRISSSELISTKNLYIQDEPTTPIRCPPHPPNLPRPPSRAEDRGRNIWGPTRDIWGRTRVPWGRSGGNWCRTPDHWDGGRDSWGRGQDYWGRRTRRPDVRPDVRDVVRPGSPTIGRSPNYPYGCDNHQRARQFILTKFRSLRYDASEQSILYFSSSHRFGIIKQNLRNSKPVPIHFTNSTSNSTAESADFAYDWITKNVYINGHKRIFVVNLNNPERTAEIISNRLETANLQVHPNKGYLFFIDAERINIMKNKSRLNHAIYRANLDGSNVVRISEFVNETMFGLAIDYYSDRLYWSIPSSKIIKHSNMDGNDVRNFSCESNSTIAFDKNYIYYVDGRTDSIVRRQKLGNEDDKDFRINSAEDSRISDFVINYSESQQIRKDHPCLLNNGDCQQFCFAVPESDDKLKRICACENKDELEVDLVSCNRVKNVTSIKRNN